MCTPKEVVWSHVLLAKESHNREKALIRNDGGYGGEGKPGSERVELPQLSPSSNPQDYVGLYVSPPTFLLRFGKSSWPKRR